MRVDPQRELFPPSKADTRLATIERLFGDDKRVQTAARYFDEAGEREAYAIAERTAQSP